MRRIGYLSLGLVLVTTTALAVDRQAQGTLARVATPARSARVAEIAKDATPPKAGRSKPRYDYRQADTRTARIPIGR